MGTVMGLIVGIGLSAACGFRVFVPLLGMSIANLAGHLTLSPGFEWIGSWPALVAFGTATILEIITLSLHVISLTLTPGELAVGFVHDHLCQLTNLRNHLANLLRSQRLAVPGQG